MSYTKVGGLRFIKIGRFGFSFWITKRTPKVEAYECSWNEGEGVVLTVSPQEAK